MMFGSSPLNRQISSLTALLIFITLVIVVGVTFWMQFSLSKARIQDSQLTAQLVVSEYLEGQQRLLANSASVLTDDFGFKQAVAIGEAETVQSALENHQQRIGADMMSVVDVDEVSIATSPKAIQGELNALIERRDILQKLNQVMVFSLNHKVYQGVVLPVEAPRQIATTLIGFELDNQTAMKLARLTGFDVSFVHSGLGVLATSMNQTELNQRPYFYVLGIKLPRYLETEMPLTQNDGQIKVSLRRSLQPIYTAFKDVMTWISLAALSAIVVSMLLANYTARGIAKPLQNMAQMARRFAQGDYAADNRFRTGSPEVSGLLDSIVQMGEQVKAREQRIRYQIEHDAATGVLSRSYFEQNIEQFITDKAAMRPSDDTGPLCVIAALSLTNLSLIDDALGSTVSRQVVSHVVEKLKRWLNELYVPHIVGRINQQDFYFVIAKPMTPDDLAPLMAELSTPYVFEDLVLDVVCHLGMSNLDEELSADKVMRRLSVVLKHAVDERQTVREYQDGEDDVYLERLALNDDLKAALASNDGQLFLNYQPKMDTKTRAITKVESLIRWIHPEKGFVSPELFIGIAEQTGVIKQVTQWVVAEVCSQLGDWNKKQLNMAAAINVSAADICDPGFEAMLQEQVTKHALAAKQITIEITERDIMEKEAQAMAALARLREQGFVVSIDDYGIGQSSLSKLKLMPADELKIDKAFILKLDQDKDDQMIVKSTIQLGHDLGLSIVAEGVENEESEYLLTSMKCDHIQGYHLSRPLKAADFETWLEQYYVSG